MTNNGKRTQCRQQMADDLMAVYREIYADCPMGTTQTEVYDRVVRHPAPRYYIDPRRAMAVISPMMRGDTSVLKSLSPLKQEMYESLAETVLRLKQRSRFWQKSLYYTLKEAVLEPAPRFYVGAKRMEQIWKERQEETRQRRRITA